MFILRLERYDEPEILLKQIVKSVPNVLTGNINFYLNVSKDVCTQSYFNVYKNLKEDLLEVYSAWRDGIYKIIEPARSGRSGRAVDT